MNFIKNKINLKNKWSLVTGATGFLGAKIVHSLADLGSNIIILDINNDRCNNLQKIIKKKI